MKNPLFVCPNCDNAVDQTHKQINDDNFLYTRLECSTCGHKYEVRYPIKHVISEAEYYELIEYGNGMTSIEDALKWMRD